MDKYQWYMITKVGKSLMTTSTVRHKLGVRWNNWSAKSQNENFIG